MREIRVEKDAARHGKGSGRSPLPSVEGNNEFAVDLYRALQSSSPNLFFSPFSIRSCLAMAHAGARGRTAAELAEVLHLPAPADALLAAIAQLPARLEWGGQHEMEVANALWMQLGMKLLPAYRERVGIYFPDGLHEVDLAREPARAREAINGWVAEKTRERIRDLVPEGAFTPDLRLVLANAIYFKGRWVFPFDEERTIEEPFFLEGGGSVGAPLMRQKEELLYTRTDRFRAVALPYRGEGVDMLVLLPDEPDGLGDLEARLSASLFEEIDRDMDSRDVKLFLPRFRMTFGSVDLVDPLKEFGVHRAFSRSEADFSGINGVAPPDEDALHIANAYHKAFVEVNEEGTEATAATVGMMGRLAKIEDPNPEFRADHPFLFAIRETQSGTILFLGRMNDPTRETG